MKIAIIATLVVGAAAFAPAQNGRTSPALNLNLRNEIGAQAPLGYFDPLQVYGDPDNAPEDDFNRQRWVELKHGRIAMLAVVGYLTTYAGIRFPGAETIPGGFAALSEIPGMVWAQMIATWAMMEAANQDQSKTPWASNEKVINFKADFIGDFRNGVLDFGWDKQSEEWKRNKRAVELNQGRAAMMGITGLMVHDLLGNVDEIIPKF